jgi:hypothetical protein
MRFGIAAQLALLSFVVVANAEERRPSLTAPFDSRLETLLLPRDDWHPFPTAADRQFWQSIPGVTRSRLIAEGEALLGKPWEPIPATMFLEFYRSGSKEPYQSTSLRRRARLTSLVLAECVEGRGRFLDEIVNGIWAISEESFWGNSPSTWVQASLGDQQRYSSQLKRIRTNLPDITKPGVDLWVAETGALLAMADYLLGPSLDKVSPLVRSRIRIEVDRRMLTPLLARDFKWMQEDGNWNPWITSNWLLSALLLEPDQSRRLLTVRKAMRSLDGYLATYPADGGCDEGPGYWRHSAGSLFDALELLHSASGGSIQIYDAPLVKDIGAYIYKAHIAGPYFTNYADAAAVIAMPSDLMVRFGRRVNDPHLMALGRALSAGNGPEDSGSLLRRVPALVESSESLPNAEPPLLRDVWLPVLQVMAARSNAGSVEGLFLGAKGGHNGEGHNHNDVGNFLIYADGRPVIIDVGPEAYTEKNSSPERYTIWTMQSAFHNLPTIGGVMQSAGRRFAAREAKYHQDNDAAEFSLDLAGAYPAEAGLQSWRRTLRLDRGSTAIQLTESYALNKPAKDITLSLMTACRVRSVAPGVLELSESEVRRPVHIRFDERKLQVKLEEIALQDKNLRGSWGDKLTRILLISTAPLLADTWTITFAQASALP